MVLCALQEYAIRQSVGRLENARIADVPEPIIRNICEHVCLVDPMFKDLCPSMHDSPLLRTVFEKLKL